MSVQVVEGPVYTVQVVDPDAGTTVSVAMGMGAPGPEGPSAYDVAVAGGFVGTEAEWLATLVGAQGIPGNDGAPGADGADGVQGPDGPSAYQVAVAGGFVGTEAEWLASLVGPEGPAGAGGSSTFRGEWGPDALVWTEDLSDGTLDPAWSTSVTGSGVAAAITSAAYPPGGSRSIEMYETTIGTASSTSLTLDISALGLANVTRIEFWLEHTAGSNQSWQTQTEVFVNGGSVLSKNGAFAWELDTYAVSETDVVLFKEYGLWGSESVYDSGRVYVSGIALYGTADPYMLHQYVTYNGKLWRSDSDNNPGTPGTSGWTEMLIIPSVLDDMTDVDTTTAAPADGNSLMWDTASGQWIPCDPNAVGLGAEVRTQLTGSMLSATAFSPNADALVDQNDNQTQVNTFGAATDGVREFLTCDLGQPMQVSRVNIVPYHNGGSWETKSPRIEVSLDGSTWFAIYDPNTNVVVVYGGTNGHQGTVSNPGDYFRYVRYSALGTNWNGSKYVSELMIWNYAPVAGDPILLGQLYDVDTSTTAPVDGDRLVFDSVTSTWVPDAAPAQIYHGEWAASSISLVPVMTADNAPSPFVASANAEYYAAYKAFNGNTTDYWQASGAPSVGSPYWLKIDLGGAQAVNQYEIVAVDANRPPMDFTFEGSDDGGTWTVLDTRTGVVFTANETKTFTLTNPSPDSYGYYRLNMTANGGNTSWTSIGEFRLWRTNVPYMQGHVATYQNKLWKSLTDNNTGTPGTSGWQQLMDGTTDPYVLLEVGQTAANVPAGTPVGALIVQKA